jgi:GNAT superfamily N-acetyltransferase
MEIRPAVVDDADAIAAVNAAGWKIGFRDVVPADYLATFDGWPQTRRDDLQQLPPHALQLVATQNDSVVGWIAGQPLDDPELVTDTYEIRACYVTPSHWRQGVARTLVQALLDQLGSSWSNVILWTPRDSDRSRRFYESVGFQFDGGEQTIDRGGPVPLVRYRRLLGEV